MLIGVKIKNFGLLQEFSLGLDLQDLLGLTNLKERRKLPALNPLSVFIGKNASGKSTFFEALRFLSEAISLNVHIASNQSKQGSYSDLIFNYQPEEYDLEFDLIYEKKLGEWLNYYLKISSDEFSRPYFAKEKLTKYVFNKAQMHEQLLLEIESKEGKILQVDSLNKQFFKPIQLTERKVSAINIFGRQKEYEDIGFLYYQISHFYYADYKQLPRKVSKTQKTGGHKHLNASYSNVENVIYYLKKRKPKEYKDLQKRLNQNLHNHNSIDLNQLDKLDNEAQIRYLISYLILSDDKPLIAFDNPDNGLYYEMSDSLALEFRDYTLRNENPQIFIATHNTNMLENFSPYEVWSFDRIQNEQGIDQIKTRYLGFNSVITAMYQEGIGLGSLLYSGYLDKNK